MFLETYVWLFLFAVCVLGAVYLEKVHSNYKEELDEGKLIDDVFMKNTKMSLFGVIIFGIISLMIFIISLL